MSRCMNCTSEKDPVDYDKYYCSGCETARKEAREHATREKQDVGMAEKRALMSRIRRPFDGRDPRMPFDRVSRAGLDERIAIEPGSPNDPRLGGIRG